MKLRGLRRLKKLRQCPPSLALGELKSRLPSKSDSRKTLRRIKLTVTTYNPGTVYWYYDPDIWSFVYEGHQDEFVRYNMLLSQSKKDAFRRLHLPCWTNSPQSTGIDHVRDNRNHRAGWRGCSACSPRRKSALRAIMRDAGKSAQWQQHRCELAPAKMDDASALTAAF